MSRQDWKSKLTARFAYSNIALENEQYEYFQTRADLAAQLSSLKQHESNIDLNSSNLAKFSSLQGSSGYEAQKQGLLACTHGITVKVAKILDDYLNEIQDLQASYMAGSIGREDFKARAQQKHAASKDHITVELDRNINEATTIIEGADESAQEDLADCYASGHDELMATLSQQMSAFQTRIVETVKMYEQMRSSRETSRRTVAGFTTAVMETVRRLFNGARV
jgi:cell division septum initiation protein DivIVA